MHKLTITPADFFKQENPLFNAVVLFSTTVALYAAGRLIRHNDIALFWPMNAVLAGLFIRHRVLRQFHYFTIFILATLFCSLAVGSRSVSELLTDFSDIAFVAMLSWMIISEKKRCESFIKITIFRLYSYCLLTAVACSGPGSYFFSLSHQIDFWRIYPVWFSEEFTTSVLILPFVLICTAQQPFRPTELRRLIPVGLLAVSLAISIATGTAGSVGTLSMILPALIWCAISYSLPTTCLLTLLAGVVEVLMVDQKAGGISLVGHVPLIISARLGIASIAISPVIVAVSVQAINTLVRQLSHQVRYDYLTCVYSRFGLYERLKELHDGERDTPLNVLVLDIDHFKNINDTWGHDCGDKVLAAFAVRVQNVVGQRGIVARLGGEEFAVIMAGKPGGEGYLLAEEIRKEIESMQVEWGSKMLSLTVSVGLSYGKAMRWNIVDIFDKLLSEADAYLYQSKKMGRNRTSAPPVTAISQPLASI